MNNLVYNTKTKSFSLAKGHFVLLKVKDKYSNLSTQELDRLMQNGEEVYRKSPSYKNECDMKEASKWQSEMEKKDGVKYVLASKDYDGSWIIY